MESVFLITLQSITKYWPYTNSILYCTSAYSNNVWRWVHYTRILKTTSMTLPNTTSYITPRNRFKSFSLCTWINGPAAVTFFISISSQHWLSYRIHYLWMIYVLQIRKYKLVIHDQWSTLLEMHNNNFITYDVGILTFLSNTYCYLCLTI